MASQSTNPNIRFAALAVDAVCFRVRDNQLQILLGSIDDAKNPFYGKKAHIGGLVRPEETADEALERLLNDKAGISKKYYEQLYTFSTVKRDPRGRVVSVAYLVLIDAGAEDTDGKLDTHWVPVSNVSKLAYDHNEILDFAVERLQSKFTYTNIAQHLLPKEFTMTDLQNLYELVLGRELDKRNFRKKILASDMIGETGNKIKKGVMRPAAGYSFKTKKQEVIIILQ